MAGVSLTGPLLSHQLATLEVKHPGGAVGPSASAAVARRRSGAGCVCGGSGAWKATARAHSSFASNAVMRRASLSEP